MTKDELITAFDGMTPDAAQKEGMLDTILCGGRGAAHVSKAKGTRGMAYISAAAVSLALAVAVGLALRLGGGTVAFALSVATPAGNSVLIEDRSANNRLAVPSQSASYVTSRPQLRFFITGENIAMIEISCESEYLSAHDFTEKLDEKYWNPELYYAETIVDGVAQKYVPIKSLLDKSHILIFPEDFNEYERVWYDWYAWDLMEWASQDNYAHYQKYGGLSNDEVEKLLENASEDEKLAIAAGGGGMSAAGHILLDGYPEDKLSDRVTITITDRQGNTVTKTLAISVSNNSFGQTVVTASLEGDQAR